MMRIACLIGVTLVACRPSIPSFNEQQYLACLQYVRSGEIYQPFHTQPPWAETIEPCSSNDFIIDDLLSSSPKARVLRAHRAQEQDQPVIIKLFSSRIKPGDNQGEEECLLGAISHPQIPTLFCSFSFNEEKQVGLVMSLAPGLALIDLLNENGQNEKAPANRILALEVVRQLSPLVHFLHRHHICHRDIKLENIIVEPQSSKVMLIDFDLATRNPNDRLPGLAVGTPGYMAPEMLVIGKICTSAVDWFSLGVVIYACVSGLFPFTDDDDIEQYLSEVEEGIGKFPPLPSIYGRRSKEDRQKDKMLLEIVKGLCRFNPHRRWDYLDIYRRLRQDNDSR